MEIVLNKRHGGFGLSTKAVLFMRERGNAWALAEKVFGEDGYWLKHRDCGSFGCDLDRSDPDLVAAVKELGSDAFGRYAKLEIVDIPDGVDWEIDEYDGYEHAVAPIVRYG